MTMLRWSQISSLRMLAVQTLLSCSTRTRLGLMLLSPLSTNPPPAWTRGNGCTGCLWTVTPPISLGYPTVTFCSVHIHNVLAKSASTSLFQVLHADMLQHNVDFIGGDFNVSACSTVGHLFADQEFAAPGSSLLWVLGALTDTDQERPVFLIMPKRPYELRVGSHGCYTFDNAQLGFGPRDRTAHLPVFLHLRTTNLVSHTTSSSAG